MVYLLNTYKALIAASLLTQIVAHPGHDLTQEIAERNEFLKNSKRDLSHCNNALKKRGMEAKQARRRQALIAKARAERGLPQKRTIIARDAVDTSHLSTLDVTPTTSGVEEIIYSNSSCLLSPEGEIGPYWVEGEYIRTDIRDSEPGVEVILDAQFIDVNTCEPVPNLMWDAWHCNSTGVYSGVVANGNGNEADTSNLNNTALRGLTLSDEDGVGTFTSIFPGHYSGRATHIHIVGHLNGTTLANGTYTGGTVAHIGQFFFDQDLITEVESLTPYSTNTITITTNADDRVVANEIVNGADPFFNYVLLGDTVADGLFMWVSAGVDTTLDYTSAESAASVLTANGGVAESSSSGSGAGTGSGTGTGMGNGTMPSGVTSGSGGASSGTAVANSTGASSNPTATSRASSTTTSTASSTSSSASASSVSSSGSRTRSIFRLFFL